MRVEQMHMYIRVLTTAEFRAKIRPIKYAMHHKFSNCFVWMIPSTSDLKFQLLS